MPPGGYGLLAPCALRHKASIKLITLLGRSSDTTGEDKRVKLRRLLMGRSNVTTVGEAELPALFPAARQHGARRFIGAEIFRAIDVQQLGKPGASAVDARVDRADGAAADAGGFLV